jgi:hypothetical protein
MIPIIDKSGSTQQLYTQNEVDNLINGTMKSFDVLPTPSSEWLGKCVILTGIQLGYVKGHLYKCVPKDGEAGAYVWEDQNLARFPVGNCSNIVCIRISGSTSASIKWTGPKDTMIDEIVLGKLAKVTLVRNAYREPININDGTVVVVATSAEQYAHTAFVDNGLAADHETYYYKLFPETVDGAITESSENAFTTSVLTWASVKSIIADGDHKELLPVGTIVTLPAHDAYGEIDMEVVGYEDDVDLEDTTISRCLVLQSRYLLTGQKQFDAGEAYAALTGDAKFQSGKKYYAKFILASGKVEEGVSYYKLGNDFSFSKVNGLEIGSNISAHAVPLYVATDGSENSKWTLCTATPGVSIPANTWYELNVDHRVNQGVNNWDTSAIRKYLNATEGAGLWWKASTPFDKPPSYQTSPGFLSGFRDKEFLGMIKPVINTNLRSSQNGGDTYRTVDKVWLASAKQLGDRATNDGVEGKTVFPKYRDLDADVGTIPKLQKMFKTSTVASWWWTRSAYFGTSFDVWRIQPSGMLSYYGGGASNAHGLAPCLVIA